MAVYRASDDPPGIASYCTVSDVLLQATGIDKDDASNVLSRLGSTAVRDNYIEGLLALSFSQINQWARKDFGTHSDVTVTLDGNNLDSLSLAEWGFYPLIDVTSLTIDDDVIDADDYKVYAGEEARIEYSDQSVYNPPIIKRKASSKLFTDGIQNISIVLSWGYAILPQDIVVAQACETLAMILERYSAMDDPLDPGIPAGLQAISESSFRAVFDKRGQFARQADTFRSQARNTCYRYQRAIGHVVAPPILR